MYVCMDVYCVCFYVYISINLSIYYLSVTGPTCPWGRAWRLPRWGRRRRLWPRRRGRPPAHRPTTAQTSTIYSFLKFNRRPQHQPTWLLRQHHIENNLWLLTYRVFIKYCVFSLKFCDFSELCQFCCSTGVLPAWCVYTHWHQGKTRVRNIIKSLEKTQYLMTTLYVC